MKHAARLNKTVLVALVAGVGAGALLVLARSPHYAFLPNARSVASSDHILERGLRTTISSYVASESSDQVLERLRKETPMRLERRARINGRDAWVVTVPRTRDNRADIEFPPAREVTVLAGDPPSVVVKEYRSPGALDALVEWVRHPLGA